MTVIDIEPTIAPTEPRHVVVRAMVWSLHHLANRAVWLPLVGVFFVFAGLFFSSSLPFSVGRVESLCGVAAPDVRFNPSAADVDGFLDACGPDGRSAYRAMQLADLLYPLVFGLFLAASTAAALRYLRPDRPAIVLPAGLAVVGAAFDYLENAVAWRAILAYPDAPGSNSLFGAASVGKNLCFWAAGLLLVGASLAAAWHAIGQRRRRGLARL